MNFQFYLEKLFASKSFQEFNQENKDNYPCSCFFAIDIEKGKNQFHFDYFVPSINKIFSFKLELNCEKIPVEMIEEKVPSQIFINYDFNFDRVQNLIKEKMGKENIKNKIQKVILSLQKIKNKDFLIGTIFISSLGILKVKIELPELKITEFEKKSFLDMFKVIKK
jgi:hypothetical protein